MKEDHGERQEFAALVQAHSRALFRAARALLDSDAAAEDAVGEAVLLAWQAFPRLRRRESARAWLLKITVNCAYDQRRRARPTVPLEEAACAAAPAQEPLGLWELVQALPEEQRLAVTLYYYDGLSVGEIAQHLGLSESHLSHLFRKETDYTLLNYLTRYRIHKAMELLRDCRTKVYEVAERVGYRDITYFSATFKKVTGMSPSEFQDTCR